MTHTGILLVNLGTPNAPTPKAVRTYLKEFLSDPRVVDLPRFIWLPLLYGFVLTVRPQKIAAKYKVIWDTTSNDAPLRAITKKQALSLQKKLRKATYVDFAMRYGHPTIAEKLEALTAKGCTDILIAPLYPQYSYTTTACVEDAVTSWLKIRTNPPTITTLKPYYNHPAYIDALAHSITTHIKTLPWTPDVILASFHGLPNTSIQKGDPYFNQCHATINLLQKQLKMTEKSLQIAFQSRMGKQKWLQPYTDKKLMALAQKGVKNILVIAPGFSADCLETLEELSVRGQATFLQNGGKNFSVIPCLNASDNGINMLQNIFSTYLAGTGISPE